MKIKKNSVFVSIVSLIIGDALCFIMFYSFPALRQSLFGIGNEQPSLQFDALLACDTNRIQKYDVAEMNLLSAQGLPGAEGVNIKHLLHILDLWTLEIEDQTKRNLYRFYQSPGEYENSEAYFRILLMVTVLQRDIGVRYDPKWINDPKSRHAKDMSFFNQSRNIFLHGILQDKRGTCSTIPVLIVAIGRRLGYPLSLVTTKSHLFARWESPDGKERFNIEASSRGLNCFPDEYYKKWPYPLTETEINTFGYLKSLTAVEELSVFLETRGLCLLQNGRLVDAELAFMHSHSLNRSSPGPRYLLGVALERDFQGGEIK